MSVRHLFIRMILKSSFCRPSVSLIQVLQRELLKEAGSLEYYISTSSASNTPPKKAVAMAATVEHVLKVSSKSVAVTYLTAITS